MEIENGSWNLRQRFDFEGREVAYDVYGRGRPLVLVHGTPWSSFNWRHIVPPLATTYSVYLFDLLGYGQSAKVAGADVSLGIQNRVLAALLAEWQLEKPLVVGHDFGGTTALRTCLLDQRPFAKLLLIDPVAVAPWGSSFFSHVRQHEAAFGGVPAYIHEAIVTAYVKGAMAQPMPPETLSGILTPWLGEEGQAAFYRQIAQADQRFTDEVEARYPEIDCPVMIVWGEADSWIPVEAAYRLQAAISGAGLDVIPGAGHLVQEDQPNRLLQVMERFLGG